MEALVAYLKRICPLLLGGTDGGDDRFEIAIANNSEVLENFVLESHSALYVQLSEAKSLEEDSKPELCYTISTNVLRGAGNATAMGFLKRKSGPLQERKAIQHQLRVIELGGNLSHFQEVDESGNSSEEEKDREEGKNHAGDNQSFEMLYGYVHHTFTPLLRSYALEMRNENDEVGGGGDASGSSGLKQSLPMLGKKLQELEYALKTCMQQTEIPEVVFNLEPEIVECVGKEEKEGHLGMEELGLESIQDDSTLLKRLKKGVNKWYEDSKQLSTLSRDASSGTALEEVRFWTNMEQALHDVDLQMKGKGVEMTLRILKHYKQFGVILAFQQDTGLTQKFSEVNSYMALIRDFPINAILTASNVKQVQQAVAAVFSHMRKMKTAQYPVKRSFQLLESVSRDLCKKLVTLLKPLRMMKLPYEIFVKENDHCSNLFKTWDEHCGGFRELAREIAKKRGAEKTSARLVVAHAKLRDRLEDVYHCRQNHEKLRHVIVTVLKPLERKNVSDSPSRGPNANNSQRENSAVMDVHDAYKFLSSADVFDVTQEGDEAWESAKKQYELRIDKVETDITATLTDLLASAKTGDEKFRVFSKFNALFFRQRIRGAIQQHQTDLIQTVKDDINALQQKFKRHYSASETERMSGLRDLPPMSAKIIWAKQIERQLDLYIQRVEAVLGSGWETHADGRLLKSTCDGFKRKLDTQPIFNDWLERIKVSSNLEVGGRIFDVIKLSSGGSSKNLELCVSFNKEIITLFKEVRNLSWLATDHYGFRVPYTVKIMSDEAKERYPYAMALTETLRTYKQISKRMSADIVVLTAKIKKSVQVTLAKAFNKHIKWDSESLEEYVKDLSKQIYALQDQVSDLLVKDKAIQSQLTALDQCPFGHDDFGTVLAKIQEYIDEMNLAEYSNLASWTESLDKKVEKILLSRLEIAIEGWVLSYKEENNRLRTASQDSNDDLNAPAQDARSQSITSQMKIFKEQKAFIELEIILRNRILQVSPALEVGRSEWMAQFQNVLRAVVSQRRIKSNIYDDAFRSTSDRRNELDAVERTKKNIYYSLLQRVNKSLFHQVYEIIELSMASLREYVNVWLRYQALWDLHPEQVVEKMGDSIEKWHQVLVEMKEARSTFDNSETEKVIGSLVINYQSVQSKVGDKYDAWHQDMLSRFGRILGKKMSEFHKKLLSSRTQLEQKSLDADTKEVVSFVTMVRGVQRDFDDLERELNMFRASQKLLAAQRFRFPEDWLYIDNIEGEWDAFQQILSRKVEVMDSQVPQLQKRILDEDRRIETRIKDTETDWKNERNERLLVSTDPSEALRTLGSFDLRLKALQEDYQNIRSAIEALGLDSPRDVRVEPMVAELKGFKEVWSALGDIWGEVDVVKEMQWTAFVPRKCRSSLDAIKKKMDIMPGRIQQYEAYRHLYTMITNYKSVCLLLTEVKSDAVKDRHWKLIIKILTLDVASPNRLVLGQLLDSPLKKKETAIKDIIRTAQGEMALEEFLKELKEYWSTNQLELVNYQNKCRLVKGWDDLFSKLDDNLSALSSMKQSPYYKVFQDEAKSWEEKLEKVRLIFDVWIDVQRRWVYLEGIFYGSADIKLQLPNEYTRFRSIDLEFVKLTQEVSRKPEVLDVVAIPNLQRQLDHLLKLLNNVQKALGEYLERQRASFPRFYFCGDEDLLEIIGNGKEPVKILKHIGKMFAGITTLQLDGDDKRTVSGMLSKEGELVGMKNPIVIQPKTIVNDYLRSVEEVMRFTLASLLDESFGYLGEKEETVEMEKYMEWVHKFPAQIIILSAQVQWSISVEKSISSLGACLKRIEFVLEKLSEKVLDVGIFVTMNPGYAGRSNLPDNLKLLFRGCAMMKPDFTLIAEVIMFSQGFKQAESIASKVVLLFDLCLDQLSKQPHYDFGLRALKSVLVSAGDLKREQLDSDEVNVMIQSALETVIPKLIAEDIKVFKSLLEGVFPGASLEAFQNQSLTAKLEELCAAKNLENSPLWITKILQLYQVQNMRHGVMMVGPTGVGKSSAWAVLLEAMTAMDGIKGESYVIDAKALNSKDELYGSLDQTTYEWSDGVFTSILRAILSNVRGESSKRHWIVFDGDVDPEWAENLNSVLDDNKILTLPNGERLPIPSNVRIMFETETLRYATLATVSRCGMVWFSEGTVNASMMIKKYVRSSSLDLDFMKDCFEDGGIIEILLEHSMEMVHVMEPTRIRLLHSMMLSRWVRALYEAIKENADMVLEDLVRIWLHEGLRLFADRLTTAEEQEWCSKKLDQIAMSHFPGADPECIARPILYSNWLSKRYQEVEADPLRQHVEARLRTFYEEELDVKLVVFDEVLDHVLRIDRVLRQPLGHLLLVGESGAGKTVLSKFCAWMNGLSIFQIKLTRKYSIEDFDVDLRNIMKRAGCEDEKICFIFDESNVLDSAFLEHMNALLASGEVPGLFEDDELSALMQEMRARTSSMVDSDEELFRLFTKNVQNNLHIVFTMNPAGGDFKSRSATSPALFNRCVVDWFGNWSVTALEHVGRELTKFVDVGDNDEAVVKSLVKFHEIVREEKTKIVSPRDFLDFISHMISIYEEKRSELEEEQRHLAIGLGKLNETAENVAKLKTGLAAKESELAKKNAQANETLQQMVKDQNEAERRKTESLKLKAELDERNKVVEERRVEAESDLAKAEPALLEAQEAVRSIKRRHLDEMKAMGNPPPAVKITLEAVICLVSGESDPKKEIPWGTIRGYLRGGSFISSVVDFQSETLMTETRELVENKFLKRDGFNFEKVSRANKACGPLYKWLRSQIEYAAIANRVAPLKMEVQKLAEENMELTKRDEELSAEISTLESSIATYKAEYAQLIKESEKIKGEMESVKSKCDRAETLLKSLSEEQDRWEDGSTTFQTQMSTLVGDVLLASAFCVYSGFFDHRKRTNLMQFWGDQLEDSGIAVKENIELTEYLSKGSERLTWKANGLPDDSLSVENGIILQRFDRYPLIIDPSGQASEFLLRQNSDRKIKTTSFLDAAFMKQLESALRFGTALMVQDVENIDPVLNPVLNREFQKTGGRTLVRLGDQEIDFSPSFLMYMTTRDPFFKFSPDVSSRVTFVNFTVTPASLESQCLGKVLKAERPDIDKQRSDLLKLQGEYQARLRELESILLQKIASVEGTILDDDKVISALEILKTEAREIGEKSANAAEVMTSVNEVSSFYQPVANACSTLYFSIEALGKIHHLYQFSLMFFLGGLDSVLAVRGHENLMLEILKKTYSNTSRGMLSEDKLTLAVRVAQIVSNPDEDLFDLLLNSGAAPTEDCEDKLFLEMMTARRDCPHELPKAAEAWVEQVMGENIVRGKEFDLATVVETESSAKTPLLLCSLPGYDASGKVLEIAKNKKIKSLSMGSGDGFALAEKYVLTAAKDGSWVLLRSLQSVSVEQMNHAPAERSRVYFLLMWFHAVVLERLQYVPIGWSKAHEFSSSDQVCGMKAIDEWIDRTANGRVHVAPEEIPWDALRTVLGQSFYGGRVDNKFDQALLDSFLETLFTAESFNKGFQLCEGLLAPDGTKHADFAAWVEKLSPINPPTWLGLSASAEKIILANRGDRIMKKVSVLQDSSLLEEEESSGSESKLETIISKNIDGAKKFQSEMMRTRQSKADLEKVSLGNLALKVTFSESAPASSEASMFVVDGLKIEGAKVVGNVLVLTEEPTSKLPLAIFSWEKDSEAASSAVPVPLYYDVDRHTLVTTVRIEGSSGTNSTQFLQRGTAIVACDAAILNGPGGEASETAVDYSVLSYNELRSLYLQIEQKVEFAAELVS
eukprot:g1635.t1